MSGYGCTYAFAAPAALYKSSVPDPSWDAYSLGAVILFYVYRRYRYDTQKHTRPEQVRALHDGDALYTPRVRPEGMDGRLFDQMLALLSGKMTVTQMYAARFPYALQRSQPVVLDAPQPLGDLSSRYQDINDLYSMCSRTGFALAVNIADRFRTVRRELSYMHLEAVAALAEAVMQPGKQVYIEPHLRKHVSNIVRTLDFKLYSDTCDWLLLSRNGHASIDYELLKTALEASCGITQRAVDLYEWLVQ